MSYKFFQNKECEYFPCHKTDKVDDFNCLFCFCPLYNQHENCGGGFKISPSGIKDCSGCDFPHQRENYDKVVSKLSSR